MAEERINTAKVADAEIQKADVEAAKRKVRAALRAKITGNQNDKTEAALGILEDRLLKPIYDIDSQWSAERKAMAENTGAGLTTDLTAKFRPRLEEVVEVGVSYLETVTRDTGWLTPEVLAKAVFSINSNAKLYMNLLQQPGHDDLKSAIKWSLEIGKPDDLPTARRIGMKALKEAIPQEFSKGDRGLMPVVWMVMAFIETKDKMEIAKSYVDSLKPNLTQIEEFLEDGNKKGVFDYAEMLELRGGPKFATDPKTDPKLEKEEQEKCATNFFLQNNFIQQGKNLVSTSYGVRNVWDDVTGGSVLRFIGKLAAGATVAGNLLANVWSSGGIKGIPRLITNHNVILATAGFGAIKMWEKGEPLGQTFQSSEERATLGERQALRTLKMVQSGNPLWSEMDEFFRPDGFSGGRAFYEYVIYMQRSWGTGAFEKINSANFKDYLKSRASADPTLAEKYTKLAEESKKLKTDEGLQEMARVFDHFKLGGADTDTKKYDELLKRATERSV